jgi:hypothetical protein
LRDIVPWVDGRKLGGKVSQCSGVKLVLMRLEPVSDSVGEIGKAD